VAPRPTPAAILAFPGAKLCSRRVASRAPHGALPRSSSLDPLTIGVCSATTDAPSEPAKSVALLTVHFLNHEDLEPTTGAERARIALIASIFKAKLDASGRYQFVSIPADAASKIAAGPEVGACGGCEFGYGKEFGADTVAWIVIQKVSDLILNINVYMARCRGREDGVRP
jgi:hypothetical protein